MKWPLIGSLEVSVREKKYGSKVYNDQRLTLISSKDKRDGKKQKETQQAVLTAWGAGGRAEAVWRPTELETQNSEPGSRLQKKGLGSTEREQDCQCYHKEECTHWPTSAFSNSKGTQRPSRPNCLPIITHHSVIHLISASK